MKDKFFEYYLPDENEFKNIWNTCYFVFDTNILLNLYRYSKEAQESLFNVIEGLGNRVWIPHQVAFEYQENRIHIIKGQIGIFNEIKDNIKKLKDDIEKVLTKFKDHPFIDIKKLKDTLSHLLNEEIRKLDEENKLHPDLLKDDILRTKLDKIINDKVGECFNDSDLSSVYSEAAKRYEKKIPPGYEDEKDKSDEKDKYKLRKRKYGDYIIWKQIINFAKSKNSAIIWVSDDDKEDWWQKEYGEKIGPRRELIKEFYEATEKRFYMYNSYIFMERATKYLALLDQDKAIQEIRNIKEKDEQEYEKNDLGKRKLTLSDIINRGGYFDDNFSFKVPDTSDSVNQLIKALDSSPLKDYCQDFQDKFKDSALYDFGLTSKASIDAIQLMAKEIHPLAERVNKFSEQLKDAQDKFNHIFNENIKVDKDKSK